MRIICPECRAAYQVGALIKNAILVCHRCQTEFDTMGNRIADDNETSQIFKAQEEAAPTFGIRDLVQSGMSKRSSSLWLFMILILILLSASGIAVRWQHWQFDGYIRAYQLNFTPATTILDRDWRILPSTIHTQWLKREDQTLALLIEGKVENLVNTALPVPEIQITFITQTGENSQVIQAITEPADLKTLQAIPFSSPPIDKIPISPFGTRGFIILLENVPHSAQHMLLHALAVQTTGSPTL